MLRNSEGETEILLGNKQLLGIFFVVVVLLGIAFGGGYKIGQGSRKPLVAGVGPTEPATGESVPNAGQTSPVTGGETHSLPAEGTSGGTPNAEEPPAPPSDTATESPAPKTSEPPVLGARNKGKQPVPAVEDTEAAGPTADVPSAAASGKNFAPQTGQTFLQVAAVSRDEAEAIADVLHKKGFRAHAVPKPGSAKIYRVIIGPLRDASELNSTRASLRNTGFREIFVQRY